MATNEGACEGANPGPALIWSLEAIALRHQIAVLKRSGTRRPCFRLWDRLRWILLSGVVAELAREPAARPTGNRAALAAQWLVRALEIPVRRSLARWAPQDIRRNS